MSETSTFEVVPKPDHALHAAVARGVRAMLILAGRDPDEPGVIDTPARFLRAWLEMVEEPGDPAQILGRVFPDVTYDGMVHLGPIQFASVCEHHLLPFVGVAHVAYVADPAVGVVGLSKLARLVEHYARRPQVQERMTQQITDALVEHLRPQGAGVVLRATHTCLALRGIRKTDAVMTTSRLTGPFLDEPATRAEFMALALKNPTV
jgi:GTP cyclohydrolase IA